MNIQGPVFFMPKRSYFYDRPNSLLLVTEPVLFINLNICGRFGGKIGAFGPNWPERDTARDSKGAM
jgi:hypothetical protein